ncbi:MAG: hypothetical protein HY867_06245 [Chloroflexi bacterium]|nr:hypothetical protein [Chloroflexota bacterium]
MKNKVSGWRLAVGGMFVFMTLTSCAVDPRKEAQAEKTRLEAEQAALDAEQARAIREREEADAAMREQFNQAVMQSTLGAAKARANTVVNVLGLSLAVFVGVVVVGSSMAVKTTVDGLGQALVVKAQLQASLVQMDAKTHSFPARLSVIGGQQFLTMLNTGQTFRLDVPMEANPQLVAALAQVATSGVLADAASRDHRVDAAGVAMIQPTIIDA